MKFSWTKSMGFIQLFIKNQKRNEMKSFKLYKTNLFETKRLLELLKKKLKKENLN